MVLDLTWECNYDCRDCIDGGAAGRKPNMPKISYDLVEDIVNYASIHKVRGLMIMGGEVWLYKDDGKTIDDFFNLCYTKALPVYMITNGSLLDAHLESVKKSFSVPGSILRISINADRDHYKEQTRSNYELSDILASVRELSESGVKTRVSTVVWGLGAYEQLGFENTTQLRNIIHDVFEAGANDVLFLPSRDPKTHKNYNLSEEDITIIDKLCGDFNGMKVKKAELFADYLDVPVSFQDKSYNPCPSNLLKALIGSDGKLYACTDHRGEKDAVIGEIREPGDFSKVWHSEERVKKQMAFNPAKNCSEIPCMRYSINTKLWNAIKKYAKTRSQQIIDDLLLPPSDNFTF